MPDTLLKAVLILNGFLGLIVFVMLAVVFVQRRRLSRVEEAIRTAQADAAEEESQP